MTSKELKKYELEMLIKQTEVARNTAYVMGKNPTINEAVVRRAPDWRISIPLGKTAIDSLSGYKGDIEQVWDTDDEVWQTINKNIYNYNMSDIENKELFNEACAQGTAYELFWSSDELSLSNGVLTPEYKITGTNEMVLQWGSSLKPELLSAIRFNGTSAIVYYPYYSEGWKKDNSEWSRESDNDSTYPYSRVPLAIYKINKDGAPLFEAQKGIMDSIDKLISESVNEVDKFSALVMLFPGKVDADFVSKLKESKIVDDLGEYDRWPEYLEKSLQKIDSFYQNLADRLEGYFYSTIQIPNFSDEKFTSAQSGIAIAYKIMATELLTKNIEIYFNQGLYTRDELIKQVMNAGTLVFDEPHMTITSQRNLPIDSKNIVENAQKLFGIVSKESLLRYLPKNIVSDVEHELELLNNELGIDLDKVE